jgi:ubiquinone/menaquinone biosynthesis C-methylase UbiE
MSDYRELYLGCGSENTTGAVGIDLIPGPSVDVVADLSKPPFPFKDNTFSKVYCHHVLEHLDNVVDVMAEIHRISTPGARVHVMIVHYSHVNMYDDPTHKHPFSYHTFQLLTDPDYELRKRFTWARFGLAGRYLHFRQPYRALGIAWFANKLPYVYEMYFCWMAPAWMIEAELTVEK